MSFEPTVRPLLDALALKADGTDTFLVDPQIIPSGRVYGGELVAQAAAAGQLTVDDDRRIHSLHGYFLRAGDVHTPTRWEVERLRDGRGFSQRVVRGLQGDRELFRAMASFQVPTPGAPQHAEPAPDLPDPESLPTSAQAVAGTGVRDEAYWAGGRSFDMRHWPDPVYVDRGTGTDQVVWLRAFEALPDDPAVHRAALAYVCDYTLLEPILRRHGAAWSDDGIMTASLDHAMWWHADGRMDDWVALVQDSPFADRGTGIGRARLYSRDGTLLASVVQEGVVRLP
ncbi:acyl-CoA thioesterase [Actinomycetospora sp. CA-084318]|uniref:acyl-CoA thioesterase n=1 Tax=Actinomycetospora sp. CA-084318 TaxID=3239892 RepID=UPI003D973EE5